MIIDAKDAILGRLSTYVAKQILLGNKVDVINCEECVVSGKKDFILGQYKKRLSRKAPGKGPSVYRRPDMFVKRTIRGMIPRKRSRGREAFKNVRCHIGIPDDLKDQKALAIDGVNMEKLHSIDYLKIKELCKNIGGK